MAGGCIVVVIRISLIWFEVKADTLECDGKQQSCLRYGEWTGHHRGLRPGLRLGEACIHGGNSETWPPARLRLGE